jgi:hypothetical protein
MTDEAVSMDAARAIEITRAVNARAYVSMGISTDCPSLDGISLAEMLEAKRIVEDGNRAAKAKATAEGGSCSISIIPDDRLIAAVYAIHHYQPDNGPILCLPQPTFDGSHIAIAVVALTPTEG